jgi:glycogen debranching enzyme
MVIKQGDCFGVFDWQGDVHQIGEGLQGIYHEGTRFLSRLELNIDGHRPMLLSASPREDNQLLMVDLTNPDLSSESHTMTQRGTVHILRSKFLWQSTYHETIRLTNYGLDPAAFSFGIAFEADFIDIFEVRGTHRERHGTMLPVKQDEQHLVFSYHGLDDVRRQTEICCTPTPDVITDRTARYSINLLPHQSITLELRITFSPKANASFSVLDFDTARTEMNDYMKRIEGNSAGIFTSNEQFNDWINRSKSDLITMVTRTPHGLYPYAGVPWYSTPFGRDGIITALECLWAEPELAKGVLRYLAATQAQDFNDFQDAEPGKIFHEARGGEMASLGEIPFRLYYGTIDATPLFVVLAGAYLERTNDLDTIRSIWPNIGKALYWIDHYGDIDGDGFVEYKTKSSKGLVNQGWKDSHDAIFYENGPLAQDPIALCEVQGYVYDAKMKASTMARALGDSSLAEKLHEEAQKLKQKFNELFWSESKQIYVLALDGKKRPCNVISSNAGHCLSSGIATPERARIVAKTLMQDTMFSGWGIRTIASGESRYNPMSYHNGSIWPHDNAIIAHGFARYNLMTETSQLMSALFDTALHEEGQRLPELFCGFAKIKGQSPTSYPVACSPQAWSVGVVFLMLKACLGIHIDAARNHIMLCHPVMPPFLREITITNLKVRDAAIILQIRNGKEGVEAVILGPKSVVTVEVVKSMQEEAG